MERTPAPQTTDQYLQWPVNKLREELTWTEIAAAICLINAASFLALPQKGWWVLNSAIGLTAAAYGLGGKLEERRVDDLKGPLEAKKSGVEDDESSEDEEPLINRAREGT